MINPKILALAGVAGLALLLGGCRTTDTKPSDTAKAATTTVAAKGGAQLWADNCNRCHNFRSPSSYSDEHWDVAMHHMRIRANLTADDAEKIVKFLKSAN